jgi:hypothetical protein
MWTKRLLITILLLGLTGCSQPNSILNQNFGSTILSNNGITVNNTDENNNETLIIKTDKDTYSGFGSADVIYSITNNGDKDENVKIQFLFSDNNKSVSESFVLNGTKIETRTEENIAWEDKEIISYATSTITTATTTKGKLYEIRNIIKEKKVLSSKNIEEQVPNWDNLSLSEFVAVSSLKRKNVNNYVADKEIRVLIKSGETKYFKNKITFPPSKPNEKFFIEAFGDKGGYGHLDPTIIFSDTFDRSNSATVGNGWTAAGTSGIFSIESNKLKINSTGVTDLAWIYQAPAGYKNNDITITFTLTATTINTANYVVATTRHTSSSNTSGFGILLKARTGGALSGTIDNDNYGSNVAGPSWVNGHTYYVELMYSSSDAFEFRIWESSRPTDPTISEAAQTPAATGSNYQLGYDNGNGGSASYYIDDYVVTDNSVTATPPSQEDIILFE